MVRSGSARLGTDPPLRSPHTRRRWPTVCSGPSPLGALQVPPQENSSATTQVPARRANKVSVRYRQSGPARVAPNKRIRRSARPFPAPRLRVPACTAPACRHRSGSDPLGPAKVRAENRDASYSYQLPLKVRLEALRLPASPHRLVPHWHALFVPFPAQPAVCIRVKVLPEETPPLFPPLPFSPPSPLLSLRLLLLLSTTNSKLFSKMASGADADVNHVISRSLSLQQLPSPAALLQEPGGGAGTAEGGANFRSLPEHELLLVSSGEAVRGAAGGAPRVQKPDCPSSAATQTATGEGGEGGEGLPPSG